MDDILKSDIFFFITSIAVIAVAAVLLVALVYLIRILRDVKEVSQRMKDESENLKLDIASLRASVREEGLKWKHFFSVIGALFSGDSEKGRTRKTRNTNKEIKSKNHASEK